MPWQRLKRLKYRALAGGTEQDHVDHWRGFQWEAGSVIVSLKGPHGVIQVWAASEAEGRRVIAHACAIAGIDPASPDVWWEVASSRSARNGRAGTFRTREVAGYVHVSMRDGPNGSPWWSAAEGG